MRSPSGERIVSNGVIHMKTKSTWLAHIADDGREQMILEHLEGTAKRCAAFAAAFDAEEIGYLTGKAHDIGKYTNAFQKRLLGGPKVDHATAGAFECSKLQQSASAFCISGHHGGLPDMGSRADIDKPTLQARLRKAMEGKLEDYSAWKNEVKLPKAQIPRWAGEDALTADFFIRMLYSCLVDADFLDTEQFMAGEQVERGGGAAIAELNEKLEAYTDRWFPPEGELNTCRCEILMQCREKGRDQAPGLFTLTVPTGGGKTVSSLAFALEHALQHGMKRVIYVIPYTSIIEQTADTFRKILGRENVLEHHSGVLFEMTEDEEANRENVRFMRATENWDMPVIVTTAVQFFESLYANKPSHCRKLHNITESVIIFDEAQMLPLPYLQPCVSAISQLVSNYHVSAVLCTATQPALDPIFQKYLPGISARELCPQEIYSNPVFKRVQFLREGILSWDEVSEQMNAQEQALCIVNSRKNAVEIYEKLEGEKYHLSTLMYPRHRSAVLQEIRTRLDSDNPKPCRVVSTSLIEAGVDVDFPQVYREVAGLDSILQAAGRCNREGKRPVETSIVTIFQPEHKAPPMFDTAISAAKNILEHEETIDGQREIIEYFQEWRGLNGEKAQDVKQIMKLLKGHFAFQTIAERFHLIENDTYSVIIPQGNGLELLEKLRRKEHSRALFRELAQYTVSIYREHKNALLEARDIMEIDGLERTFELVNLELYSWETGLFIGADRGKADFI